MNSVTVNCRECCHDRHSAATDELTDNRLRFIQVDEKGTEAAAATALIAGLGSTYSEVPPVVFRADRPFVFGLRHESTRQWLFLGRLIAID